MGHGGLKSVGGSLYIQHNDALTALTGLDALDSTSGSLYINGRSGL